MDTLTGTDGCPPLHPSCPCQKTVEVTFTEQAKAVVAQVSVKVSHPAPFNSKEVLTEAEELFALAYRTSSKYSFDKNR
jgi:hypothetical protein